MVWGWRGMGEEMGEIMENGSGLEMLLETQKHIRTHARTHTHTLPEHKKHTSRNGVCSF